MAPIALLAAMALFQGCAVKVVRTDAQPLDRNLGPVMAVIEDGDWVVIRGVDKPANFIGSMTNMPFSHSSIYDAEKDMVIESEAEGVHYSPLSKYIGKAQRVWIVKPVWATPENRHKAVERARTRLGKPYDFLGLIGLQLPWAYYCTELVVDAWRPFMGGKEDNPIPRVISPGRLHHWGRVVYDSMEIGDERKH
ncbi:MAG: hypothetical protein LBF40_09275 [Deltaproteobacteria bacterium]|jgi:hypothetical protein|nr:hypothetical protein [Deltaproteobacteria bacterium]